MPGSPTSERPGLSIVRDGKPVTRQELSESLRSSIVDCIAGELVEAEPFTRAVLSGFLAGRLSLHPPHPFHTLRHGDFDAVRRQLAKVVGGWHESSSLLVVVVDLRDRLDEIHQLGAELAVADGDEAAER